MIVSGSTIFVKDEHPSKDVQSIESTFWGKSKFTGIEQFWNAKSSIFFNNNWESNIYFSIFQVRLCTFYKYGGSGIYATIRNGKIKDCTFFDVPCEGSSFKLDNSMTSGRSSFLKLLNNNKEKKSFIVSGCNFNFLQNDVPSCGVFFVRGKSDVSVELKDCKFNGKLAKDSHYIDGVVVSNDSPKMIVKNCQFENSKSKPIILDSEYLSIDDEFSSKVEQKDKSRKKALAVVVSTAFLVAIIAAVGFVLIALRRKKNTLLDENEMPLEASSFEVENDF